LLKLKTFCRPGEPFEGLVVVADIGRDVTYRDQAIPFLVSKNLAILKEYPLIAERLRILETHARQPLDLTSMILEGNKFIGEG